MYQSTVVLTMYQSTIKTKLNCLLFAIQSKLD